MITPMALVTHRIKALTQCRVSFADIYLIFMVAIVGAAYRHSVCGVLTVILVLHCALSQ